MPADTDQPTLAVTSLEDEWYALSARADQDTGESDKDAAAIGLRDGYEQAVQTLDVLTGGDGEFRCCTMPDDSHCPDPPTMIRRILARTNSEPRPAGDLREAAERLLLATDARSARGRDHVPSMREEQEARWLLRQVLATHSPAPMAGEATDAQLKDAVSELLSHRGERPERVLRGGHVLWETWLPAFRAALRYLPSAAHPSTQEG